MLKLPNSTGMLYVSVPNAGNIREMISLLIGGTNHPHYDHYYWHPHPYRGHVREYVKGDSIIMAKWLDLEILELIDMNQMLAALNPVSKIMWKHIYFAFLVAKIHGSLLDKNPRIGIRYLKPTRKRSRLEFLKWLGTSRTL